MTRFFEISKIFLALVERPLGLIIALSLFIFSAGVSFAGDADPIVIGASMSRHPAFLSKSLAVERGSRLYFDKINRAGGIGGRKIKYIVYEDQNDGKEAARNTKKLIDDDHALFIFQAYGAVGMQILPAMLKKEKVPLLAAMSPKDYRKQIDEAVFSVRPGFVIEAQTMIDYLTGTRGFTRVGILSLEGGPGETGSLGRGASIEALRRRGLDAVGTQTIAADLSNLDAAVGGLKKSNPQAVVIFTRDKEALEFVKKSIAADFKPIFVVGTPMGTTDFIQGASKITAGKTEVFAAQSVPSLESDIPLVVDFNADAKAAGLNSADLTPAELEGYFHARFAAEVLRRAGDKLTREKIFKTVESMTDADIAGIKINLSPTRHTGVDHAFLVQVEGGKLKPIKQN